MTDKTTYSSCLDFVNISVTKMWMQPKYPNQSPLWNFASLKRQQQELEIRSTG